MVAQIRARRAPGLVGEGHKRIRVPRLLDEALARVFYRGCAGLGSNRAASTAYELSQTLHATAVRREPRCPEPYAIDAAR